MRSIKQQLISRIRFGFYGSRKLARLGHPALAKQYRDAARHFIAELRALRAKAAA